MTPSSPPVATARSAPFRHAVGGLPVGIIPAGTGNVLATEIGLSRSAAAIADVLVRGPDIEIEGGNANGAPFFLMAGAGFDGAVVHALDVGLKRRIGKAAYTLPALRTLLTRPVPLEVTVDGAAHAARWVVVTKASRYGGSFVISREAGVLKSGLRAVLFSSHSRLVLLRQLLALAAGKLESEAGVDIFPCRHVTVDGPVLVPVQIDGDDFGFTPLVVEAGGPRLRLIVPPEFAAHLVGRRRLDRPRCTRLLQRSPLIAINAFRIPDAHCVATRCSGDFARGRCVEVLRHDAQS